MWLKLRTRDSVHISIMTPTRVAVTDCPEGWGRAGTICETCKAGFYSLKNGVTECQSCYNIDGVYCKGENEILIERGCWVSHNKVTDELISHRCPPGSFCRT